MKLIITKKAFTLTVIAAVAISGFVLLYPKTLSPKETVELYFTHFNNKNAEGIWSLVSDPLKGTDSSLEYLEYAHLLSCYEELDNEKTDFETVKRFWYPEAEFVAKMHVTFDIKYTDNAPRTGGFENGVYYWVFYLAKKTENDPWIIVSYGN